MNSKNNLNKLTVLIILFFIIVYSVSCSTGDDDSPSGINDLNAVSQGKLLNWTSPGDDGEKGQATLYLIRYFLPGQIADLLGVNSLEGVSFTDIQTTVRNNFDDATQVPEFIEPQSSGNPEFFSLPRIDITGNTDQYYAVSTNDEVGNTSAVSNVVQVNTPLQRSKIQSNEVGNCVGMSIASGEVGGKEDEEDPDEDSVNDLIVGDPCLGVVYIFFGGIELVQLGTQIDVSQADLTIIGDPAESFGSSVEAWGSFHDTFVFREITIGAPDANGGRGKVYVVYGDEDLPSLIDFNNGDEPDVEIIGEAPGDNFGAVLESTSATSDDMLIGAPGSLSSRGKVYFIDGDDLDEDNLNTAADANNIYIGEEPGDMFGSAISEVGDVDDSSPREFAISSPGAGKVYVFFDDDDIDLSVSLNDVLVIQGSISDRFGEAISGGFNINGEPEDFIDFNGDDEEQVDIDDETDLVIGAPGANGNTGTVFVYVNEDLEDAIEDGVPLIPVSVINGANPGDNFGASLAVLPDINPIIEVEDEDTANVLDLDSSSSDILIGAPGTNGGTGSIYIFFGEETFSGNKNATDADITINGTAPGQAFGSLVLNAGEINDDLFLDFLVGGDFFIDAFY